MALEILLGTGYSFECDCWSLEATIFECLTGWPPFCAEAEKDIYNNILKWRETLARFPDDLSKDTCKLLHSWVIVAENGLSLLTTQ